MPKPVKPGGDGPKPSQATMDIVGKPFTVQGNYTVMATATAKIEAMTDAISSIRAAGLTPIVHGGEDSAKSWYMYAPPPEPPSSHGPPVRAGNGDGDGDGQLGAAQVPCPHKDATFAITKGPGPMVRVSLPPYTIGTAIVSGLGDMDMTSTDVEAYFHCRRYEPQGEVGADGEPCHSFVLLKLATFAKVTGCKRPSVADVVMTFAPLRDS